MKRIPTTDLKPGMFTARPVRTAAGQIILDEGCLLSAQTILHIVTIPYRKYGSGTAAIPPAGFTIICKSSTLRFVPVPSVSGKAKNTRFSVRSLTAALRCFTLR